MSDDAPNNLRAWRKYRGLTQQQVADMVEPPTTKSQIAALETGQNGLSAKWLRRLAPVLRTTPGFLLDHDPNEADLGFLEAAMSVPKEQRAQVSEIIKVLKRG